MTQEKGAAQTAKHEVRNIPLNLIVPDENQPRKDFDAGRLDDLQKSIVAHGILTPLVVEEHPGGKYLLVDGERRYRAAKELKLKEVPALIQKPKSGVDRLVQQFHIQEQHQGWSSTEKAAAVIELAKALNLSVTATSELLAIPQRTIGRYLAFGQLMSRGEFQKQEIPLDFASPIVNLRAFVKKQYIDVLNEEFDKGQERELEHAIIRRVKNGEIRRRTDIVKLHDSIKANPKIVEKFIKDEKVSLTKLFIESKARVAFNYRNVKFSARALTTYTNTGLPLGLKALVDEDDELQRILKSAAESIRKLLA